jgi:hypothetical protein
MFVYIFVAADGPRVGGDLANIDFQTSVDTCALATRQETTLKRRNRKQRINNEIREQR